MANAYKYKKVDAFTASGSLGNPAACLYLEPSQALSDRAMLEIARQHKGFVSEVVYLRQGDSAIHLTYYSSECEVDFCGHGTIACLYGLIKDSPDLLAQSIIKVQTNRKGALNVYNRIPDQDAVFITAPEPEHIGTRLGTAEIAEKLGAGANAIHRELPVDLIDAGLRTLIVPMRDLKTEISLFPDQEALKAFCAANGIDILLIYSMEAQRRDSIAHTRVFAPKFGYLEDPATGSGNSAFGHYMLKNGLWDGRDCQIEQGGEDRVFNSVHLSTRDGAVIFGGSSTIRIEGAYYA